MDSRLHVIGIGLDGPAGLSQQALAQIATARILAGPASHLRHFGDLPQIELEPPLEEWIPILQHELAHGSLVLLATGDPLFFGIGRLLTQAFRPEQLVFYPTVSSVQLAFSRARLPWQDAVVVSVHGRPLSVLEDPLKSGSELIAVLTDAIHGPAAIAQLLMDLRLPSSYRLWVCSQLGSPREEVVCLDPLEAAGQTFAYPNVVIVQRQPDPIQASTRAVLGLLDADFHTFVDQPGLITKREVRVLTLALLQLLPEQVVWDIGAGTGSVSIEIARLCPSSRVFAIEKGAAGLELIGANCRRFGVANIQIVAADAPDGLSELPQPDRILVGGGGSRLMSILPFACQRLATAGILVGNFATLEAVTTAQQFLQQQGWSVSLLQVQLARSVSIAQSTRFSPLNPVILLQSLKTGATP